MSVCMCVRACIYIYIYISLTVGRTYFNHAIYHYCSFKSIHIVKE